MSFLVIPAVDLKDGKCVRLVQGDPRHKTVEIDDPISVAKSWEEQGASRLHLVDLNGALEGVRRNENIAKKIVETLEIPVQFGGGIRSFDDASTFLDYGVERVILGTAAAKGVGMIEKLNSKYGPERLTVALDTKEGRVVTQGWVKKTETTPLVLAKMFEGLASECLFTNVDVEGLVRGIDLKVVKNLVNKTSLRVIASGGVSSIGDLKAIKNAGAFGSVVGTALYKGKIDFKEALKLQEI